MTGSALKLRIATLLRVIRPKDLSCTRYTLLKEKGRKTTYEQPLSSIYLKRVKEKRVAHAIIIIRVRISNP